MRFSLLCLGTRYLIPSRFGESRDDDCQAFRQSKRGGRLPDTQNTSSAKEVTCSRVCGGRRTALCPNDPHSHFIEHSVKQLRGLRTGGDGLFVFSPLFVIFCFCLLVISMRPLVIADSDDESDSSEHHTAAPAVTPTLPPAPIRSPEQGSVATASTGSAIFQQIFNEQNGAALEKVQQLQRDLDDAPHESSAMTIPDVPFQRTTKGFYHSSTTTTTESPMDKFPDIEVADPCAAWPRMTSREEKLHEKEVGVVDPWEVPSSPDAPRPLERQSKRNSHATHDYAYKRDGLFSANDALPDRHSDFDEAAQRRSRKRRRLDESRDTLSATDEADLIMLPSSSKSILQHGDETGAASSISLPTMPLDAGSTSSPTHPSPIGREQVSHPAMDSAPTGALEFNNLLLKQQTQTQYAVGSSGTATNINTQRTQMSSNQNFSSLAPEEPDVRVGTTKAEYRNYRLRRSSSPDIISTLAPVLKNAAVSGLASQDITRHGLITVSALRARAFT